MVTAASTSAPLIEKHTIGYVPPEDRHGKTRDLFILWFGGNIAPLPIVTLGARLVVLVPWTAINLIDFWLANRDTAYKRRLSTGTFVNSL